jgi:hypothetical protein
VIVAAITIRPEHVAAEVSEQSPAGVAKAYLRAVQARDFAAAYGHISSADRKIRDKAAYLRGQQPFSGFALELARWFATEMRFSIVEERHDRDRVRLNVGYRLPSGDEIAAQLLDWNPEKLNALPPDRQAAIFTALEKIKRAGNMIMVEGRETIDLVQEQHGWRVYEDWRSRQRVLFQTSPSHPGKLGVEFLRNDILVKPDEPFQVDFKISNQTRREMRLQLKHAFVPAAMEKKIDMIACGSLAPFRLAPGEVREISSVYLLRSGIAARQPVTITYQFATPSAASAARTLVNTR